MQQLAANLMLTSSLMFQADALANAPQFGALLSSAQAALRGAPDAAGLLLQRVPVQTGAAQHGASWLPVRLFADHAAADDVGHMRSQRWASCARFLLVLSTPCLRDAASTAQNSAHESTLRSCAELATPILCGLAVCDDVEARAAATEFALALAEHCSAGPPWLGVLLARWVGCFVCAVPDMATGDELQAAMHGVATGGIAPNFVLTCCQLITNRAHMLLQQDASPQTDALLPTLSMADTRNAEGRNEQAVESLTGSLMVAIVWGHVSALEGVLRMVQGVWQAGWAVCGHGISAVILQHLLQCHDHRKKQRCVRWYHERLRALGRSAL